MVDEAHGLGVFGESGRGVCHHFGVQDDIGSYHGYVLEEPGFNRRFHCF